MKKNNLIVGVLGLIAYVSIGIFGLVQFNHMADTPMVNCPYTQNGYSVCANSLIHINDWREFSNAVFPSLLLLSILFAGLVLYFFDKRKFFNDISGVFYRWKYYLDNKKLYTPKQREAEWLSLFLNSPSLSHQDPA